MPVRRRYFKKKLYASKKSKPMRRRMRKVVAKRKAYSYDGIVKHKFMQNYTIQFGTGGINALAFGHHFNASSGATMNITQALDFPFRASQYKQFRYKGMKLEIFPAQVENQTNNRLLREINVGSYPYRDGNEIGVNLSTYAQLQMLQQRRDFKCYSGRQHRIVRYYKLPKTLYGSDIESKEAIGKGGWLPVQPGEGESPKAMYGATVVSVGASNWTLGDAVARVTVTWYVEFKDMAEVAL